MNNNEQNFPIPNKEANNEKKELEIKDMERENINNSFPENIQNLNQFQNLPNNNEKDKDLEDQDGTDNLRYISNSNYNNNNINFFIQQRLDSCDSAAQYKFSIDLPNVPKQRLHEYLNDDLLNELDYNSPSIPNINSGISNNKKLSISNEINDNNNNNSNNLFDFSLYPKLNDNNNGNLNNQNKINSNANIDQNMNYNLQDYNNNISNNFNNMNNNNNYNNGFYFNNFPNFNYMNNNITNLNYNMNNPQVYIPTKLRNKEQMDKKEFGHGQKNQQYNNKKEEQQNNAKNKFDNNDKKNGQNLKKEKNKKHFEIRAGDWTCNKCNNLNFSFRNKCNRCGLPKELNKKFEPMNPEIFGQNPNYQVMNGINTNIFYGNANVNNINNMNNSNEVKFNPK